MHVDVLCPGGYQIRWDDDLVTKVKTVANRSFDAVMRIDASDNQSLHAPFRESSRKRVTRENVEVVFRIDVGFGRVNAMEPMTVAFDVTSDELAIKVVLLELERVQHGSVIYLLREECPHAGGASHVDGRQQSIDRLIDH